MNHKLIVLLGILVLYLAGCGRNIAAEIPATVQKQVATAVSATRIAIPTATAYPSPSPYPTASEYPTEPPLPTSTAYPTATAYPTPTPYPTDTPTPTDTPSPSPTATATALPTTSAANQPPPTTGTTSAFTAEVILNTLALMNTTLSYLSPDAPTATNPTVDWTVDCPGFLAAHDHFVNNIVPPISTNNPTLQNAYLNYQTGVNIFLDSLAVWLDVCRQAVVNQEVKVMNQHDLSIMIQERNRAHTFLEQARLALVEN
jgi:hypothetical protein